MQANNADNVARAQLALFDSLSTRAGLAMEERHRVLGLKPETWRAWTRFVSAGPGRPNHR